MMHTIAAKAVALGEAQQPSFADYGRAVIENAKAMGEELQRAGARLVAGGTDTHLLLVDLGPKSLTGKAVEGYLGMGIAEAREIGKIIGEALDDVGPRTKMEKLRGRVGELTSRFDVP